MEVPEEIYERFMRTRFGSKYLAGIVVQVHHAMPQDIILLVFAPATISKPLSHASSIHAKSCGNHVVHVNQTSGEYLNNDPLNTVQNHITPRSDKKKNMKLQKHAFVTTCASKKRLNPRSADN